MNEKYLCDVCKKLFSEEFIQDLGSGVLYCDDCYEQAKIDNPKED